MPHLPYGWCEVRPHFASEITAHPINDLLTATDHAHLRELKGSRMITIKVGNNKFKHYEDGPSFKEIAKKLQAAFKRKKKLWKAILKADTPAKLKKAQHHYAASPLVNLTYVLDAIKDLKPKEPLSFSDCDKLAKTINLFAPTTEKVFIFSKKKANGKGYRFYCKFGLHHKVGQKIVADLVGQQFTPAAYQYNVGGKGIQKAMADIKAAAADGYTFLLRLDVKKFFDSFDHTALALALPLETNLIGCCAIGTYYVAEPSNQSTNTEFLVSSTGYANLVKQAGIPQGSAASPMIGSYFMSKLDMKLPDGVVIINYVDDFLVMAKTPEAAIAAQEALQSALADLSVGAFKLVEKSGSLTPNVTTFLGHDLSFAPGGELSVNVSSHNIEKINYYINTHLEKISDYLDQNGTNADAAVLLDMVTSIGKVIYSWLMTFSQADNFKPLQTELLEELSNCCKIAGVDFKELTKILESISHSELEDFVVS